jgi:energy-coupling factor transporter ATP-binding protein EcfA2
VRLTDISPGRTDRAVLCGQNGCGKTVLARFLLQVYPTLPSYVLDWKGEIRWTNYKRFTKLKQFVESEHQHKIYAPNINEIDDHDYWNAFFNYAYRRKNCQVYVDETSAVTWRDELPRYYRHLIARGRERGIRLLSSTQRPTGIPQIVLSESSHYYCFTLRMVQDRERVEKNSGIAREAIAALKRSEHRFFYANEDGVTGPHHLTIQTAGRD